MLLPRPSPPNFNVVEEDAGKPTTNQKKTADRANPLAHNIEIGGEGWGRSNGGRKRNKHFVQLVKPFLLYSSDPWTDNWDRFPLHTPWAMALFFHCTSVLPLCVIRPLRARCPLRPMSSASPSHSVSSSFASSSSSSCAPSTLLGITLVSGGLCAALVNKWGCIQACTWVPTG